MHIRLAIAFAVFASVDVVRKMSSQSNSEMRKDPGPVLDQDSDTHFVVQATSPDERGPDERFENQTHEAKMSQIWWKVIADQSMGPLPKLWDAVVASIQMMALNSFFEYWRDEKPMGQPKVLHMQAVACKFSMNVLETSPYTGIFAPGTTTGLFRMGPPAPNLIQSGMSIKWFRSYVHSGNTVMAAAEKSENFFEKYISNHVDLFSVAPDLLEKILGQSMCAAATGLSDLAMYDQDGNSAGDNVNFPYELVLEPANRALAALPAGANYTTEILKLLGAIPVGTKLYVVKVRSNPDGALEEIGEFNLASQCATSLYADTRLAFKHFRMDDDLELRPEWIDQVTDICQGFLIGKCPWHGCVLSCGGSTCKYCSRCQ